jgi:hypothetical protein
MTEKFFYKYQIIKLIKLNHDYKLESPSVLIILFSDIVSAIDFVKQTILTLVQELSNFNDTEWKLLHTKLAIYIDHASEYIHFYTNLIKTDNQTIYKSNLIFHFCKFINSILKESLEPNSRVLYINTMKPLIMDKIINPIYICLCLMIENNEVVQTFFTYYPDISNYFDKLHEKMGINKDDSCLARYNDQITKLEPILNYLPDEFLDPLLFTPINNPVVLPSSKNIVDKTIIESHIIKDGFDPFNREPLTIDDLTNFNEKNETKSIIYEFLEKKKDWIRLNGKKCEMENIVNQVIEKMVINIYLKYTNCI